MSEESERWKNKLDFALQGISDIESYVYNIRQEDLRTDRMRLQAIERSLEIIGEATHTIPEEIRQQYDHIPWADIYGMRNVLSHGYDVVDWKTIWETVKYDLGGLEQVLLEIRSKIKNGQI